MNADHTEQPVALCPSITRLGAQLAAEREAHAKTCVMYREQLTQLVALRMQLRDIRAVLDEDRGG